MLLSVGLAMDQKGGDGWAGTRVPGGVSWVGGPAPCEEVWLLSARTELSGTLARDPDPAQTAKERFCTTELPKDGAADEPLPRARALSSQSPFRNVFLLQKCHQGPGSLQRLLHVE